MNRGSYDRSLNLKGGNCMWVLLAMGSAFFAGVTAILAKCGIRKTDSTVATAVRTIVVLAMSFLMVLLVGSIPTIGTISWKSWLFLILSGLSTGASWLCYFRALQLGDVNKVVPIDKSSTILTMLLAMLFLGESITWLKVLCMAAITVGTYLMIDRKQSVSKKTSKAWVIYAVLSAVFAATTSILGKVGIHDVESNLGTMLRTAVVLGMAWMMVFVTGKRKMVFQTTKKELVFIGLSGLATGASWLCYYKALQMGPASVVVPIDKLSILVTIAFSHFVLREKLSWKSLGGLALIVSGTLALLLPW